jgi:hypothetical protein
MKKLILKSIKADRRINKYSIYVSHTDNIGSHT